MFLNVGLFNVPDIIDECSLLYYVIYIILAYILMYLSLNVGLLTFYILVMN